VDRIAAKSAAGSSVNADDPQPEVGARASELASRLDPNAADWRELAAIPQLGEKKAKAIVAFREDWLKKHPNDPPFRGPQDLRLIKGIGPATVSNMMPYLIFPSRPTTRQ
jgi:DNA uptake protein ComE-like DNA-binding protein